MKSTLFALSLLLPVITILAVEPEKTDLSGYYTPDIVRNQLDLQLNSNSFFNATEASSSENNSVAKSNTLDLKGNINANLYRYVNTRKLISTFSAGAASSTNFNHQRSESTDDVQLMPERRRNYTTLTNNQLGVNWENNHYLIDKFYLYYSLGANVSHTNNLSRAIRESDLQSFENKAAERTRSALLAPGIGLGVGRIERVEDMRQAIYIVDAIQQQGRLKRQLTGDELFRFSQLISAVKNKRFLDSRLHLIDEITTVDGFLTGNGLVDKSDAAYFTSLYDMWQYGDLFSRKSGSELQLKLFSRLSVSDTRNYLNSMIPDTSHLITEVNNGFYGHAGLTYTYEKPFRLNWQHSARAGANATHIRNVMQDKERPANTSAEVFAGYQLGFYPSTRTRLQAGISQSLWSGKVENVTDWTLMAETVMQCSVYYYVSRQVRVSGNLDVNRLWMKLASVSNSQLSSRLNMTLTYSLW